MTSSPTTGTPRKLFSVLLVDDSDDDRLFVRRALRLNPDLEVVGELRDGEEAIAYLSGEGQFGDRANFPIPDLLLLDLKLPKKSGHEVLEWLQSHNPGGLHVVVVSGSCLPEDITRSLELGASAYFEKESSAQAHKSLIDHILKLLKDQS